MSNQVEISAVIHLRPEVTPVIDYLKTTRYIEDHIGRWEQAVLICPEAMRFPAIGVYALNERCDRIPFGTYAGVENEFILDGNRWEFVCSTSNYRGELEDFLAMLPTIAVSAEVTAEHDEGIVVHYELKGHTMAEVSRRSRYDPTPWG